MKNLIKKFLLIFKWHKPHKKEKAYSRVKQLIRDSNFNKLVEEKAINFRKKIQEIPIENRFLTKEHPDVDEEIDDNLFDNASKIFNNIIKTDSKVNITFKNFMKLPQPTSSKIKINSTMPVIENLLVKLEKGIKDEQFNKFFYEILNKAEEKSEILYDKNYYYSRLRKELFDGYYNTYTNPNKPPKKFKIKKPFFIQKWELKFKIKKKLAKEFFGDLAAFCRHEFRAFRKLVFYIEKKHKYNKARKYFYNHKQTLINKYGYYEGEKAFNKIIYNIQKGIEKNPKLMEV